eukprot:s5022_g1.t1
MALESEAAFQSRALEIGITSEDLTLLKTGGINSYSRYAFCCAYQPGSGNEDVLFTHLETILGVKPQAAEASNFRRLFFESHALALKDLQSRLERSDNSEVKIPLLAEKVQRLEALKQKFPGIMLSTSLEPSHELIDRVVHQYEENCVKLIELHKCMVRQLRPLSIHIGLPCGTCSRARERKLPAHLREEHSAPPPLRSAEFLMGVPDLKGINLAKEFFQEAKAIVHPKDPQKALPDSLKEAVLQVMGHSPVDVAKHRLNVLLAVQRKSIELQEDEQKLKDSMDYHTA